MLRSFPLVYKNGSTAISTRKAFGIIDSMSLTGFGSPDAHILSVIEDQYVSGNSRMTNEVHESSKQLPMADYSPDTGSGMVPNTVWELSMASKCSLMMPPKYSDIPSDSDKPSKKDNLGRWKNLDPVDMESVERDHFLKTGQVLRTRHVEAKVNPPVPGARLRQVIALHVLDNLDTLSLSDFGTFLSLLGSVSDPHALYHRDLKIDAQFKICKKLLGYSDDQVASILVPACLALNSFDPHTETPSRVWRRKILPVIRRSLSDEAIAGLVDSQNISSILPPKFRDYDTKSRRVLVASLVISSGRIRPSNSFIINLKTFIGDVADVPKNCLDSLLEAQVVAGIEIV